MNLEEFVKLYPVFTVEEVQIYNRVYEALNNLKKIHYADLEIGKCYYTPDNQFLGQYVAYIPGAISYQGMGGHMEETGAQGRFFNPITKQTYTIVFDDYAYKRYKQVECDSTDFLFVAHNNQRYLEYVKSAYEYNQQKAAQQYKIDKEYAQEHARQSAIYEKLNDPRYPVYLKAKLLAQLGGIRTSVW